MSTLNGRTASVNIQVRAKGKAQVRVSVNVPASLLSFGNGNAKLDQAIFTFSLPAGHSCPNADACKSTADRKTGYIKDGPRTEFRCYAASMEARHSSVRRSRWNNFEALRACRSTDEMVSLILESLTAFAGYVRVHDSGDFYSESYLVAWMEVARRRPRTTIYAYTKALPFWVAHLDEIGDGHSPGQLANFVLTASYGGTHDHFIEQHGLRYARVVYSEAEAEDLGLEIDHDDSHATRHGPSFSLLIHGTQPQGSLAAKAVSELRAQGEFGYGEKADVIRAKHGLSPVRVVRWEGRP
jgi:hypothetical protein